MHLHCCSIANASQAATAQLHAFQEDVAPPYVQLVFEQPGGFMAELQRDSLAGLKAAVLASHPEHTLGVVVLGLKSHVQRMDNQSMRQVRTQGAQRGGGAWPGTVRQRFWGWTEAKTARGGTSCNSAWEAAVAAAGPCSCPIGLACAKCLSWRAGLAEGLEAAARCQCCQQCSRWHMPADLKGWLE